MLASPHVSTPHHQNNIYILIWLNADLSFCFLVFGHKICWWKAFNVIFIRFVIKTTYDTDLKYILLDIQDFTFELSLLVSFTVLKQNLFIPIKFYKFMMHIYFYWYHYATYKNNVYIMLLIQDMIYWIKMRKQN